MGLLTLPLKPLASGEALKPRGKVYCSHPAGLMACAAHQQEQSITKAAEQYGINGCHSTVDKSNLCTINGATP
jgi:hypothetical protein